MLSKLKNQKNLKAIECVLLAIIFTLKEPSPEVNPANQFGYRNFGLSTVGLTTGTKSGKANCSLPDKLKFIDALMATI